MFYIVIFPVMARVADSYVSNVQILRMEIPPYLQGTFERAGQC